MNFQVCGFQVVLPCSVRLAIAKERALVLDKQGVQMSTLSASQCLSSVAVTAPGFSSAGPMHLAMVCSQIWGNFYVCVFSSVFAFVLQCFWLVFTNILGSFV